MTWRLDLTRTAKQSPLRNWGAVLRQEGFSLLLGGMLAFGCLIPLFNVHPLCITTPLKLSSHIRRGNTISPFWEPERETLTDPHHSSVQLFFHSTTRASCSSCKSQLPEAQYFPILAKCPRSCNCLPTNEFVPSLFLIGSNFCFLGGVIYSMFEQTSWFVLRVKRVSYQINFICSPCKITNLICFTKLQVEVFMELFAMMKP